MSRPLLPIVKSLRALFLAGAAAGVISGCALNSAPVRAPDFSGLSQAQAQDTLSKLGAAYRADRKNKANIIYYAAALRAAGQPGQAVSVIEAGLALYPNDVDMKVNYAKALTSAGRYSQALTVITDAISPDAPDWHSLLVKGAILDQMGSNADARAVYQQALLIAPNAPEIEANIGLSYAMSNDLPDAEAHLRKAVSMRGATSKIWQNLALVLGLEGHFDAARAIFARELPPPQVEANMAYIRALLTQQNRWKAIKGAQ